MSTSSHLCYNTKTSFEFRASFEHLRFFSQHFAITLFDNTEIDVILNFPSPATNTATVAQSDKKKTNLTTIFISLNIWGVQFGSRLK